jgi:hypothetical protein
MAGNARYISRDHKSWRTDSWGEDTELMSSSIRGRQEMKIIHETKDFRKYEPEIVKDRLNNNIKMTLCEELDPESGRWEPYYAIQTITQKRG